MNTTSGSGSIRVDCGTCLVRGPACHDCVVTVLLGPMPGEPGDHGALRLGEDERSALDVLAGAGLVPPLRLVTPVSGPEVESA